MLENENKKGLNTERMKASDGPAPRPNVGTVAPPVGHQRQGDCGSGLAKGRVDGAAPAPSPDALRRPLHGRERSASSRTCAGDSAPAVLGRHCAGF